MIHGGCDSAGCYAIEDAPAQEVFTAVRDALKHGQKNVQLQIYPFRMNFWNMAVHRNDPNYGFWQQLKAGYDRFDMSRLPVDFQIINRKYVIR
jgi:murein L,D-transpeptidase YafK